MSATVARAYLALLVLALTASSAGAEPAGRAGPARLCPQDAPPGVRLPDRPGCEAAADAPVKAGGAPGTIEIVPGTTLRIGGRVRLDYDARR